MTTPSPSSIRSAIFNDLVPNSSNSDFVSARSSIEAEQISSRSVVPASVIANPQDLRHPSSAQISSIKPVSTWPKILVLPSDRGDVKYTSVANNDWQRSLGLKENDKMRYLPWDSETRVEATVVGFCLDRDAIVLRGRDNELSILHQGCGTEIKKGWRIYSQDQLRKIKEGDVIEYLSDSRIARVWKFGTVTGVDDKIISIRRASDGKPKVIEINPEAYKNNLRGVNTVYV